MANSERAAPIASDIRGLKYLEEFEKVLAPLADAPTHGNRAFFLHHWVSLLLLYFFTPVLTSLRAIQQATELKNVQKALGIKRIGLSTLSEAAGKVFDPELLRPVMRRVAGQVQALPRNPRLANLPGEPTAVDGSYLRCLAKMTWALFRRKTDHRAVKMHVQFNVLRGLPSEVDVRGLAHSESSVLRERLQAALLYILDRGYIHYSLYQAIHDAGSWFVARLKDNSSYEVLADRPLTQEDRDAGVICDQEVRIGSAFTRGELTAPVRRVVVQPPVGTPSQSPIVLLTNTDVSADVVAELYRHRWQVELFFRWFKCILGCNHWVSTTYQGMTLQVYVAILASLLISLWTGRKPTKRTFEMICFYFMGWATAEELTRHIASLKMQG